MSIKINGSPELVKSLISCVRESTNIEDRCAVAVVENQDHVDAIESDRLPCRFGNTLS